MPLNLNDSMSTLAAIAELEDVQGNILKGHGRDFAKFLFLNFKENQSTAVKTWIRSLVADGTIVSTARQLEETEMYHQHQKPGGLFGAFFLSSKGYDYLEKAKPEKLSSMRDSRQKLNDPPLKDWEEGFRGNIHAMLLLADDDAAGLNAKVRAALLTLKPLTDDIHIEHGNVLNNEHGDGIEHFGYADGVSQPIFLPADLGKMFGNGQETEVLWDPSAPLDLVLVKDPNGEGEHCYGSYFVFRKLEQNVKGFKELEEELAEKMGLEGEDEERAGALVVGRFEDGTPVVMQSAEGMHNPIPNGFNYDHDPAGNKCPFHAHIRKVNPRGDTDNLEEERKHRIARRGIPYGTRLPDFSDRPVRDVGLLFMCYQQDIVNQFEFIQANWANHSDRPTKKSGLDPIIGQGKRSEQEYPIEWNGEEKYRFTFEQFVTLKGGEYFFAPSICFLKNI